MAEPTELEKLLAEEEKETKDPALDPKDQDQKPKEDVEDPEVKKKQEHLENINKAIREGNEELKKIRTQKKGLKNPDDEEELPKINMDDPGAKAWDKHISDKVNPALNELDKEKEEVRTFALQRFLEDKPALAKNPDKIKEMISYYDKIRTASERTQEGVLVDLNKAYAVVFSDEILRTAREGRIKQAQADSIFSDVAVERGSTGYSSKKDSAPINLTEDDKAILARWGMSPDEWIADKKKYG